jgi:hypothetical protein
MFKTLFGKKTEPQVYVTAKLNAKLQPMHRDVFEDPLEDILSKKKLGSVTGGGTALTPEGEVDYCDLEIALYEASAAQEVIRILDSLGAPKGSALQFGNGRDADLPFGRTEGLGLYLNGTDLPDEVYAECDSNIVYERVSELIDGCGGILSHWQGPTETALYLYGDRFDEMRSKIEGFLAEYPLCQRCRVIQIA